MHCIYTTRHVKLYVYVCYSIYVMEDNIVT